MKKLAIILFACASLAACTTEQASPEKLAVDAVYNTNLNNVMGKSKSAAEVVSKMQSIKLNTCPADFVDAYRQYIKAWDKFASLEKEMYSVNMPKATTDMENFVSDYQTDPTKAVVALKKEWQQFSEKIDSASANLARAFANLTSIGAKYGSAYPRKGGIL